MTEEGSVPSTSMLKDDGEWKRMRERQIARYNSALSQVISRHSMVRKGASGTRTAETRFVLGLALSHWHLRDVTDKTRNASSTARCKKKNEKKKKINWIKDYAFRGFLLYPDPFLECQRFVNLALHQGEEQPDTELFLRVGGTPFYILRYLWSDEGEEENCGGWGKDGGNRSVLINWIVFHILFML